MSWWKLEEAVIEMASCDAQELGSVDVGAVVIPADVAAQHSTQVPCMGTDAQGRDSTHVGRVGRAKQTIPPAIRRKVMRRDHGRCVVPGCRHATFVDLHHVEARADVGAHDEDNLIVLCSAHHRALHRGQLEITGRVTQGLRFRRSDGGRYGALDSPRSADACERAFRGLRALGFGERESRRAIEQTRCAADTEAVLRRALALLTERAA